MSLTRRRFMRNTAASAAAVAASGIGIVRPSFAEDDIVIATIFDQSGGLEAYGSPMTLSTKLAVEEINAAGGLLGRNIRLIQYDPQSNMQLYAQYAQEAALKEHVAVVHGAITSASREVIRPILRRYKTLLWYSVLYEGGVCDINNFVSGTSAVQQTEPIMDYGLSAYGPKCYYIGADYNAPQIIGDWAIKFARDRGGEVLVKDMYPMDVTEFGPTINKIQSANPDFIYSCLVGGAHSGFYRQWAAAGMLNKIPIVSITFGVGGEQKVMPAGDSEGIVTCQSYYMERDTPENNTFVKAFQDRFGADAPYITVLAAAAYEGVYLWAKGVEKAGSIDREAVIAGLRSGISWRGPSGDLTIDPITNHVIQDVHLARVKNQAFEVFKTIKQVYPSDVIDRCNLVENPDTNEAFTPDI